MSGITRQPPHHASSPCRADQRQTFLLPNMNRHMARRLLCSQDGMMALFGATPTFLAKRVMRAAAVCSCHLMRAVRARASDVTSVAF